MPDSYGFLSLDVSALRMEGSQSTTIFGEESAKPLPPEALL